MDSDAKSVYSRLTGTSLCYEVCGGKIISVGEVNLTDGKTKSSNSIKVTEEESIVLHRGGPKLAYTPKDSDTANDVKKKLSVKSIKMGKNRQMEWFANVTFGDLKRKLGLTDDVSIVKVGPQGFGHKPSDRKGVIVYMPSGSGKTYAVKHNLFPDVELVDGDTLVNNARLWPDKARWWEDTKLRIETEDKVNKFLENYARENSVILLTGVGGIKADLTFIPPAKVIEENLVKRKAEGNKYQPTDITEVNMKYRAGQNCTSWDDTIKRARILLNDRSEGEKADITKDSYKEVVKGSGVSRNNERSAMRSANVRAVLAGHYVLSESKKFIVLLPLGGDPPPMYVALPNATKLKNEKVEYDGKLPCGFIEEAAVQKLKSEGWTFFAASMPDSYLIRNLKGDKAGLATARKQMKSIDNMVRKGLVVGYIDKPSEFFDILAAKHTSSLKSGTAAVDVARELTPRPTETTSDTSKGKEEEEDDDVPK